MYTICILYICIPGILYVKNKQKLTFLYDPNQFALTTVA